MCSLMADSIPVSEDHEPRAGDNPRHAVWINDRPDGPLRLITVRNPGEERINVEGVIYAHSGEATNGRWIYTRVEP